MTAGVSEKSITGGIPRSNYVGAVEVDVAGPPF
ncbi:unknown [Haloarcula marismortui ATCC 43049]|uniref:Uncharacterized protein n=1 Tax=Haloarcula marismortui (strain ATCC 43049 / DSM 3752 / JCM 8966 / VKM B-1809) TaxID=272569 RepID=Q5UWG2_HALMA|nr:unknown [Haloarcula marismortui ATCC 43049]